MQRFKNFAGIQAALETSTFLELNPQKNQIRRKVPIDLNVDAIKIKKIQDEAQSRSLYAVSSTCASRFARTYWLNPGSLAMLHK